MVIQIFAFAVCLSEMNDNRNAMAAFEKAATMPDVDKYPLAYLNCAIFCYQNQEYGPSWKNLNRYLAVVDHKKRPADQQKQGSGVGGGMRNVRENEI